MFLTLNKSFYMIWDLFGVTLFVFRKRHAVYTCLKGTIRLWFMNRFSKCSINSKIQTRSRPVQNPFKKSLNGSWTGLNGFSFFIHFSTLVQEKKWETPQVRLLMRIPNMFLKFFYDQKKYHPFKKNCFERVRPRSKITLNGPFKHLPTSGAWYDQVVLKMRFLQEAFDSMKE